MSVNLRYDIRDHDKSDCAIKQNDRREKKRLTLKDILKNDINFLNKEARTGSNVLTNISNSFKSELIRESSVQ